MPAERGRCALAVAVALLVLVAAAVALKGGGARERFVTPQGARVATQASSVFAAHGGAPTYSEYKVAVEGADPVQFQDVRRLHRQGRLTPATVSRVL